MGTGKRARFWLLVAAGAVTMTLLNALQIYMRERLDTRPGVDWNAVLFQPLVN